MDLGALKNRVLRECDKIKLCQEKTNAFISFDQSVVLAELDRIETKKAQRAKEEEDPLALWGLMVGVKDNICSKEYKTTCGSQVLSEFHAGFDAPVLSDLKKAGAILMAKTNMDEFGMGSRSQFSYYGPVKNPHNPEHTAGGSSGGSAAALGYGVLDLCLGSDTGGSVRQPAAYCGIYGFKPTYGALSRFGLVAYASSLDHIGLLARDIEVLRRAFKELKAHEKTDQSPRPRGSSQSPPPEKYAYIEDWIDFYPAKVRDFIKDSKAKALKIPYKDLLSASYYTIALAEASANLARYDGISFGHLKNLKEFPHYASYVAEYRSHFGSEVKKRIMMGSFILSEGYYEKYYAKAKSLRKMWLHFFYEAFTKYQYILAPTTLGSAPPLKEEGGKSEDIYESDQFTVVANLAGFPAINVPVDKDKNGLALGVQIWGPHLKDHELLDLSSEIGRSFGC